MKNMWGILLQPPSPFTLFQVKVPQVPLVFPPIVDPSSFSDFPPLVKDQVSYLVHENERCNKKGRSP
jgi:hypothetical protein